MTEPPKKATVSAAGAPLVAAAVVVRTFAFVAAYIPKKPAAAEAIPPTKNDTDVFQPSAKKSRTPTTRPKTTRIESSRFMKVIAPRWISSAMALTFASPSGYARTSR